MTERHLLEEDLYRSLNAHHLPHFTDAVMDLLDQHIEWHIPESEDDD